MNFHTYTSTDRDTCTTCGTTYHILDLLHLKGVSKMRVIIKLSFESIMMFLAICLACGDFVECRSMCTTYVCMSVFYSRVCVYAVHVYERVWQCMRTKYYMRSYGRFKTTFHSMHPDNVVQCSDESNHTVERKKIRIHTNTITYSHEDRSNERTAACVR